MAEYDQELNALQLRSKSWYVTACVCFYLHPAFDDNVFMALILLSLIVNMKLATSIIFIICACERKHEQPEINESLLVDI